MISRRIASRLIFGGAFLATSSGIVKKAAAERVFNHVEMRWEEVDTSRINARRRVPAKYSKRRVNINTDVKPGTIIIHTDEKFLYYVTGKNKAIRYGVGVGREGFTWKGDVRIKRKAEWPTWTPPAEMRRREAAKGVHLPVSMKGGIKNPLGARALYLFQGGRDTLYRIHGTNQPWSIGLNLSSGCIRMLNKDVEDLYDRVSLGSRVVVIGQGQNASKVFRENKNPFAALFSGS